MIATTPAPPYYAVIFSSVRTNGDHGYEVMAQKMFDLASSQDGFLAFESARKEIGITVSYWRDLESIQQWRMNEEHMLAKEKGRTEWYKAYTVRISKVEKEYGSG